MNSPRSLSRSVRRLGWRPLVAAAGLLALLSGCVVYPAGYYGPPRPAYWHDGYYR